MSTAHRKGIADAYEGNLAWPTTADANIHIVPMDSDFVVNKDTQVFYSDVSTDIYPTTAPEEVPAAQRTIDISASGKVRLKVSGTITFPALTQSASLTIPGFIVYRNTGTPTTSPLIGYLLRSGGNLTPDGNTIAVTFDGTSGALEITGNSV